MVTVWKNGIKIDCTVEEYRELFPETQEQPTPKKVVVVQEKETTKEEIDLRPVTDAQKKHSEAGKGIKKKPFVLLDKHFKSWSAKDDAYLRKHREDFQEDVAVALGRTEGSIRNRRQVLGLTGKAKSRKPTVGNRNSRWSKEEVAYLRTNYDDEKRNFLELSKALMRTETAVYVKIKKLGIVNKRAKKETPIKVVKENDGRIKRMKFVSSRAQALCKNMGWNYNKAFLVASEEWKEGKDGGKPRVFPKFKTLAIGSEAQLIPFVHHAVSNKGTLTFDDIQKVCMPVGGYWNSTSWGYFLEEFILLSKEVARYFGVYNRFSIVNDGQAKTERYIQYG